MEVGCASIDLYCDTPGCRLSLEGDGYGSDAPAQFNHDERVSGCRALARKSGWTIRAGLVLCPSCTKRRRRSHREGEEVES